jgi:hypothetical protein
MWVFGEEVSKQKYSKCQGPEAESTGMLTEQQRGLQNHGWKRVGQNTAIQP